MLTALATAVHAAAPRPAAAADGERPGSELRPQKADVLVFAEGDHADEVIKPQDLKLRRTARARLAKGSENLRGP